MANFDRFRKLATRLVDKNGADIAIIRQTDVDYEPSQDRVIGPGELRTELKGAIFPVNGTRFRPDGSQLTANRKITISAEDLEIVPLAGDMIEVNGELWGAIEKVDTNGPDGLPISHDLFVTGP